VDGSRASVFKNLKRLLQHGQLATPKTYPDASRRDAVLTSPSGSRTCKAVFPRGATRHHLDGGLDGRRVMAWEFWSCPAIAPAGRCSALS